jgi:hypothetical protein
LHYFFLRAVLWRTRGDLRQRREANGGSVPHSWRLILTLGAAGTWLRSPGLAISVETPLSFDRTYLPRRYIGETREVDGLARTTDVIAARGIAPVPHLAIDGLCRFPDGGASAIDEHKQAGEARYHNRAQWSRRATTLIKGA